MVAVAGVGNAEGAVYKPDVEIVPLVEVPPIALSTCQVTVVLFVPVTVAVNCIVWPG